MIRDSEQNIFEEFQEVENLISSPILKDQSYQLNVVNDPYIFVQNNEVSGIEIDSELLTYLLSFNVANLGEEDLIFVELSPKKIVDSFEIIWAPEVIPGDGKFYLILISCVLTEKPRSGMTLFVLESNSINKPNQSLIYYDRGNNASELLTMDGVLHLPILDDRSEQTTLDIPLNLDPLPLFGDYDLDTTDILSQQLSVFGRLNNEANDHLWGRNRKIIGKNTFKMSLDDDDHQYYFRSKNGSFPDPDRGKYIRFIDNKCYSVIQLSRYMVRLNILNCVNKEIKINFDIDTNWIDVPEERIAIEPLAAKAFILKIDRNRLKVGMNTASISITNKSNRKNLCTINLSIDIKQPVSAIFPIKPVDGQKHVVGNQLWGTIWKYPVEFACFGNRKFFITISNLVDGNFELISFQNNSTNGFQNKTLEATINTALLPPAQTQLPLLIDTGCYLSNKRFINAELILDRPIYLRWNPRFLHLRFSPDDSPISRYITFDRSDHRNIDISLLLSDDLKKYFDTKKITKSCWQISQKSEYELPTESKIVDEITVTDKISKFSGLIPVRIDFSHRITTQ